MSRAGWAVMLLAAGAVHAAASDSFARTPVSAAEKRAAYRNWDAGVNWVLKEDFARARVEWTLCLQLDAGNRDCEAGLKLLRARAKPAGAVAARRSADLTLRATRAYGEKRFADACRLAREALDKNPGDQTAYSILLLTRSRKGSGGGAPVPPAFPPGDEPLSADDARRQALKYWNNGIIYFQKGDYAKARDEWLLCKQFNPANRDCQTGLRRIDDTYGGLE